MVPLTSYAAEAVEDGALVTSLTSVTEQTDQGLAETEQVESVTDVVYTIGWTGNLSKVTGTQLVHVPTRSIYAEIWIDQMTGKEGQVASIRSPYVRKLAEHKKRLSKAISIG
ncbi:hypothetical protein [Paenibacillus wynnii]|uniref:hypothetical protein n=1 Tax=Paenibacillus wynnii TaxID=268407 RepID=UPI002794F653|nr:hypothetical protein [Paenibacillus wynnii]MDQ0193642.1 hypothetical protein [Paenibacillus wynnii]